MEEEQDNSASSFNGRLDKFQYTTKRVDTGFDRSISITTTKSTRALRSSSKRSSTETESSNLPQSSQLAKRRRASSKYADPSKYAHLEHLKDILEPNLICVFVGFNPGVRTAAEGHAYAHPSNLFWRLLHSSGLTDRRCKPEEDRDLPRLYAMGNTNLVSRPTKDTAELSKAEMAAGTPVLEEKIRKYKPEAVCIVGKSIWESIWRYRYGRNLKPSEFKYGWQDEKENMGKTDALEIDAEGEAWQGAKVFVTTSTSGLAASLKPAEKEAIWRPFGDWVNERRAERIRQTESNIS
ncbi:DNA glycosylase [Patellaria atrata CBS 101060]|uniref:DNA glycosylase n=1 Tax=Patellaria atrata CBS 101060 TaxID=1346257 RepID=A0A9P4VTD9_9PEZI|nr:DNA glycosylase [Patellaria atrata CBS 101060]